MPYKRPEEQYKISRAREMIEQLEREKEEAKIPCPFSTVRVYKKIEFSGAGHAGTLVHHCRLLKDHEGMCKCAESCGVEFKGWK